MISHTGFAIQRFGKYAAFALTPLLLISPAVLNAPVHRSAAGRLAQPGLAAVPEASRARVLEGYGRLPLSFETNQGQTDRQVKFLSRGSGYSLFLVPTEAVLVLKKAAFPSEKEAQGSFAHGGGLGSTRMEEAAAQSTPDAALRIKLVGANPAPKVEGLQQLPGKVNYFIGNDPKKWRANVPTYAAVKVQDIYPGVDMLYHGDQGQLESDFVVAPGADPTEILLNFRGGDKLEVDARGDLVVYTKGGEIRQQKPFVYQEIDGVRQEISGSYLLKDRDQVGFQFGAYDAGRPLVIDPVLAYSTYLGGTQSDTGYGIAVDSAGNAYVTGATGNFPITPGAYQTTYGGSGDAFVTKLNADGSSLVYSTYLGGSGQDEGHGIALDSAGNAYVTGRTSGNFPTTPGAYQTTFGGGSSYAAFDAFITKLSADGSSLVYSTYLGGRGADFGDGIAVDSVGNAYVTGIAESTNFPTTPGALQTTYGGGASDAFVTKLRADGSSLAYSTYLGGGGNDGASGIAVDSAGNAYVTGTTSGNFPTTSGAFQTSFGGGSFDAFVTKLSADGSSPVYSTYLGGNDFDSGRGIAVDSAGNAYVSGFTFSGNFPTTVGAFQTVAAGGSDAFITKLSAAGSSLVYSTYLGGSGGAVGYGIAVDSAGSAYLTGYTGGNFPITLDAPQTVFGGGGNFDAFVTKLSASGSSLVYSTYLGGSGADFGYGIAVDSAGNTYVAGATSGDFDITPGAAQTTFGGGFSDAFVVKIGVGTITNTPVGGPVFVRPEDPVTRTTPVTLTFANVTQEGLTTLTTSGTGAPPPPGFQPGSPAIYYQLNTTAVFSGSVSVCINYGGITFGDASKLRLFHFEGNTWMDVTVSRNTANMVICGSVTSLSSFAIFESAYSATIQPPIKADGTSVFSASRGVVPVKFTLQQDGAPTCQLPPATIAVTRTAGGAIGPIDTSLFEMAADNGPNFRIDTNTAGPGPVICQYVYNLAAPGLGPGSYLVQILVGPGPQNANAIPVGSAMFGLR